MTRELLPAPSRRSVMVGAGMVAASGPLAAIARSYPRAMGTPLFRRGVNIHHMTNWPEIRNGVYLWPPFTYPRYRMSDAEVGQIRAAGFDFVRLTVDQTLLMDTGDPAHVAGFHDVIVSVARRFLSAGLGIIVDLHPNRGDPRFRPDVIVADENGPLFQRYVEVAAGLAAATASLRSPRAAFELMNEPPLTTSPADVARWNRMLQRLHDAARAVAPALPLLLDGVVFAKPEGTLALDTAPYRGSNVIVDFHYYEPLLFTAQNTSPAQQDITALPWPARAGRLETSASRAEAMAGITAPQDQRQRAGLARSRLEHYFQKDFSEANVTRDFTALADWAGRSGVARSRMLMGEFGVARSQPGFAAAEDADRFRWLSTVRRAAEDQGFGWCLWCYKGHDLGLTQADGSFDQVTLSALDLGVRGGQGRPTRPLRITRPGL